MIIIILVNKELIKIYFIIKWYLKRSLHLKLPNRNKLENNLFFEDLKGAEKSDE